MANIITIITIMIIATSEATMENMAHSVDMVEEIPLDTLGDTVS